MYGDRRRRRKETGGAGVRRKEVQVCGQRRYRCVETGGTGVWREAMQVYGERRCSFKERQSGGCGWFSVEVMVRGFRREKRSWDERAS